MKRYLLIIVAIISCAMTHAIGGKCGDNLTWSYDEETKTLTISGRGDMYDYSWGSDVPWISIRSSIRSVILNNGITSIGSFTFCSTLELNSISIPNSVRRIGDNAFMSCFSLQSITIPNSVKYIGEEAFYGSRLVSIKIPNDVTYIGKDCFYMCTELQSIDVDVANTMYSAIDGVLFNKDITTLIFYPAKKNYISQYAIPDGVTKIEKNAFVYSDIGIINIPSSVIKITDTFAQCHLTTSFNVDSNNPVYSSLDGVLFDKKKTTLIQYPICKGETSYSIPERVNFIGEYAFAFCKNLTSITIPSSVSNIGSGAFSECNGLTSILIPNSVTSIGGYAFLDCKNLTTALLSNNILSIEEFTFNNCKNLCSITIPNRVTRVKENVFTGCTNLKELRVPKGLDLSKSGIPRTTQLITYERSNPPSNITSTSTIELVNQNISTANPDENATKLVTRFGYYIGVWSRNPGDIEARDGIKYICDKGIRIADRLAVKECTTTSDAVILLESYLRIFEDRKKEKIEYIISNITLKKMNNQYTRKYPDVITVTADVEVKGISLNYTMKNIFYIRDGKIWYIDDYATGRF